MASPYNILVTLPSVDFYQVMRGERQFLLTGPLAILQQAGVNYAQAGTVRWRIGKDLPCLKSAGNTYIYAVEGQPELFYSVVCPPDAAAHGLQAGLDNVLFNFTSFQDSSSGAVPAAAAAAAAPPGAMPAAGIQAPSQTSRQVAAHMVQAGQLVAAGLVAAAQLAAHGIEKGAQMAVAKTPAATEPMKPEVKQKLQRAASATSTAVTVTKAAASTLATFAGVAAHVIQKHVEASATGRKLAANQDVQVIKGAAGQAATDVGTAWQQAARLVVEKGAAAGHTYIQHKFGTPTGAAPAPGAAPPAYPPAGAPNMLQMQAAGAAFQQQQGAPAQAPPAYTPPPYIPPAQQQAPSQGQYYPPIPTGPTMGTPMAQTPPGTPHPQ